MRKLVGSLLAAALVMALAPAAAAVEPPAADLQSPAAAPAQAERTIALDDLFAAPGDCAPADAVAPLAAEGEAKLAIGSCGACSDPICQGALRGQGCGWDSGGQKHCNIFSGGFRCPTGGWECQCQSGPLP